MIEAARKGDPGIAWEAGDIAAWRPGAAFDLVFSNAALHWVPDHAALFPRLMGSVAAGGALAVQMPSNFDAGAHRAIAEVARSPAWAPRWPPELRPAHVGSPEEYYRVLAPHATSVEIWQTEYLHVLPDAAAILEWVKGTTLRPYLSALPAASERASFLGEVRQKVAVAYPPQPDGRVLFPFRRLFLIAHR